MNDVTGMRYCIACTAAIDGQTFWLGEAGPYCADCYAAQPLGSFTRAAFEDLLSTSTISMTSRSPEGPAPQPVPEQYRNTAGYPDDVEAAARRMCEYCDKALPRRWSELDGMFTHWVNDRSNQPCAASYLFAERDAPPHGPAPQPDFQKARECVEGFVEMAMHSNKHAAGKTATELLATLAAAEAEIARLREKVESMRSLLDQAFINLKRADTEIARLRKVITRMEQADDDSRNNTIEIGPGGFIDD